MAGFLGGSSGSGGGGEIQFPAEFIDPVTKLRVSEPETLIDTDFEYGLQPTKWETVELINNTPSFFSKSGDTTINGILAMVTTATSREVKVTTQDNHGLAVGIPINVSGTKSITADGSYIINSIPDPKSFTYLAKQNQDFTASIFDLYTSIITGEFFQGSQIKISDSQGIVTNAGAPSVLTVQTDSPHGFQVGTPFYFLNLNSTVSQQFDASNTGAKTFDSSNSATAQSFDGSNTLTSYALDFNNKALLSGTTSATATFNAATDTITVTHTAEGFSGKPIGTPLYYNVSSASGYFNTFPRGIVYLASTGNNTLGGANGTSTFSVSAVPGGDPIDITVYPNGTFQLANNAFLFAGNNTDTTSQTVIPVFQNANTPFDGANNTGSVSTVNTYSGTIIQLNNDAGTSVSSNLYTTAMVLYTTTGTAASGLTNNTTYWVTYYNEPAGSSVPGFFQIKVAATPGGTDITVSGGTGTQKFTKIGVSVDKDYFHVQNHGLTVGDLVRYSYPAGGAITIASNTKDYFYVEAAPDANNFTLTYNLGVSATGGTVTEISQNGFNYRVHSFTTVGSSQSFVVTSGGQIEYLVVAGGGAGSGRHSGGGGGGQVTYNANYTIAAGTYPVTVGDGGSTIYGSSTPSNPGGDSFFIENAKGGGYSGGCCSISANGGPGGSGGGSGYPGNGQGGASNKTTSSVGAITYGNPGGGPGATWGAGGGGAGQAGFSGSGNQSGYGGNGIQNAILGPNYYWGGGGGGSIWDNGRAGDGGLGGGGGGGGAGTNQTPGNGGGSALTPGENGGNVNSYNGPGSSKGGNGGANTGGGGGGSGQSEHASFTNSAINIGGRGGSGIVVIRYKI
jgi:hypothetical protein